LSRRDNSLYRQGFALVQRAIFQAGTFTAMVTAMKKSLMLFAAVALLAAVAGCNQSNTANDNSADTNSATQNAEQSASNAWQDTKSAATNAWNATKDGATNAWNKTTNAVSGGSQ
jgi:hypothetical protein